MTDFPHQAPPPPPAPLAVYVGVIAKARLRAAWRRLRRRRLGLLFLVVMLAASAVAAASLAGLGLTLGVGLHSAGDELMAQLARFGLPTDGIALFLPAAVFFIGWFVLFFMTFAALLGTLYLRRDLPMLLVAPVPVRAVFLAQFLEALALPLYWTLVLALPLLWGYGRGMGFDPAYFLLAPLLLVVMPLVPLGLSAMATLVLLRLVPAPRASEILTVLGTLFGVGIWILTQSIGDLLRRLDPRGQALLTGSVTMLHPALPWAWAARGLVAAGSGDTPMALGLCGLYVALGLGTLAGSVILAERLYYDGWLQGEDRPSRRRARAGRKPGVEPLAAFLPAPALAVARKDWRLMRRDPRGYAALLWILAMLGFWTWRLARGNNEDMGRLDDFGAAGMQVFGLFGSLTPVAAALFLSGFRWGMESVSRDQQAFQIVLTAPVKMRDVVVGKWLAAYLPSLVLALVVMLIVSLAMHLGPWTFARNLAILVPILAAETGIMLAIGAARPNFQWTDPKEMAGGLTGCLGGLAAWGFMGVALVVVALGLALPMLFGLPPVTGMLAWLIVAGLSGAVMAVAVTFAAERLAAVEL